MRRAQRSPWIAILLATVAGTAVADGPSADRAPKPAAKALKVPGDRLTPFSPACRPYAVIPPGSPAELRPWQQRLSLAACQQEVALAPVTTVDELRPMLSKLDAAMEPSIAIYRDAIAHGPPSIRILATYDLGMTYVDMIVRARNTIVASQSAFGGATYGGPARLSPSQSLHLALEALLAGHRESAVVAFRDVARLAADDPGAAHANYVVEAAVKNARIEAETVR